MIPITTGKRREKLDKYLDLAKGAKKSVEHESDYDTNNSGDP